MVLRRVRERDTETLRAARVVLDCFVVALFFADTLLAPPAERPVLAVRADDFRFVERDVVPAVRGVDVREAIPFVEAVPFVAAGEDGAERPALRLIVAHTTVRVFLVDGRDGAR